MSYMPGAAAPYPAYTSSLSINWRTGLISEAPSGTVYITRPFSLIIELTVVTTNIQTVAGILLKVRRQPINQQCRDDAGRHDPAELIINAVQRIRFGSITTRLSVILLAKRSTRSSSARHFPSPFTRMSGTSFSSSSRAPWKNSAELTGACASTASLPGYTWRTDRPRPTSPRRRPTSYNRCYDNGWR
ncbi:Uncharacterised protein [Salmonella enterica subsp. enterica]|uniref:Uncharacterized protein n=1 Tax=Salmonella enterica I TaxID=59201 RepID=A0A379WGV1_SALET|nr:Uncharacterised protein [Salmonella enterica subsp. enterica]